MALDMDDPRPSYVQMADALRRAVAEGTYANGTRLPSVRTLAKDYSVATATVVKAIDVLKREGVVISRPGLGTVVRDATMAAPGTVQDQVADLRRRVEALEAKAAKR